jgi:hypothetical protein
MWWTLEKGGMWKPILVAPGASASPRSFMRVTGVSGEQNELWQGGERPAKRAAAERGRRATIERAQRATIERAREKRGREQRAGEQRGRGHRGRGQRGRGRLESRPESVVQAGCVAAVRHAGALAQRPARCSAKRECADAEARGSDSIAQFTSRWRRPRKRLRIHRDPTPKVGASEKRTARRSIELA